MKCCGKDETIEFKNPESEGKITICKVCGGYEKTERGQMDYEEVCAWLQTTEQELDKTWGGSYD